MTNQRLASFQTAFQNLQLLPLVTVEQLNKFHVEYGTEILEELEHLVEDCSPNNNKIIFTGIVGQVNRLCWVNFAGTRRIATL